MSRPSVVVAFALLFALGVVAVVLGSARDAQGADAKRLAYVHVSGRGSAARAWYQGAPPTGVGVQEALDKFTSDGYRFVAMSAGGVPGVVQQGSAAPAPAEGTLDPVYVILLER